MSVPTLSEEAPYAFSPAWNTSEEPRPIVIVFDGVPDPVPTALVGLTLDDAIHLCDRLNARLGLDPDAWIEIAAQAMRRECGMPPVSTSIH